MQWRPSKTRHSRYTNVHKGYAGQKTILIGLLHFKCLKRLWGMTLVTVYQTSPEGLTSVQTSTPLQPLITLFSMSHIPAVLDVLCESHRLERDRVKVASHPSHALCLTQSESSRTRLLIFNKCWESP